MARDEAFEQLGSRIASRRELVALGASGRALTTAVRGGHLIRARRDHYALRGTPRPIIQAVRVGGRLGCISALESAGVFAVDTTFPHIHMERTSSRSRHPNDRFAGLNSRPRDGVELHWTTLIEPGAASAYSVGVVDALAQMLRCQDPWHAIASLDSALFTGRISGTDLDRVFSQVPGHLGALRALIDGRAEAGQESILRMIVRDAGLRCEPQVTFRGVGRVDLLVEGCLVIEADSRLAHDGWELHVRDRGRDIDLARLGYPSLRPAYQRTMSRPADVRDAILGLVAIHRNARAGK